MKRHKKILHQPSIKQGCDAYATLLDYPPAADKEIRLAYMAGAATLFYLIIGMLDEGIEPTPGDLQKMDAIHKEIDTFAQTFDVEILRRMAGKGEA